MSRSAAWSPPRMVALSGARSARTKEMSVALARLNWERDGADWPNRQASSFVKAAGFTWHVQRAGQGPPLLLVHGTGASTHSVAGLFKRLALRFTVVAPDLPGHGFSQRTHREDVSLPGMSRALGQLLKTLGFEPQVVVGHSAGAAVLVRMALDCTIAPKVIVCINGALLPFSGFAGRVFSPLAKLIARSSIFPQLVALRGRDRNVIARVLKGTGSVLDERQLALYQRLFANPAHVAATLDMMAQWDLAALSRELPKLDVRLILIAAGNDEAVPADWAFEVEKRVGDARVVYLRGVGHLAHEEQPDEVASLIIEEAQRAGVALPGIASQ